MTPNRRTFLGTMMGGAAVGLAQTTPKAKVGGRKMIVRVDDVGMSKVCNLGTFETIEHGVASAADVMLDSPGTEDALERLKAYPWISVGWHTHMWGAPVTDGQRVPSLVEKSGPFAGRFRSDLAQAPDVAFDEAVTELRAQLTRCIKIVGRVPDTGGSGRGTGPWGRAMAQVTDEFGMPRNFATTAPPSEKYLKKIKDAQQAGEEWAKHYSATTAPSGKADEKWASRKIFHPAGTTAFVDLLTDSVAKVERDYDPVLFYTEDRAGILTGPEDVVYVQAWHPGYIDYYTYRLGERSNRPRAQQFVVGRAQDVAALCDVRLRNWIKQNRIELVNFRDALYGTTEYQNHLRFTSSDLYMRG